jgi:transcriptional regulator with XRE-family HTH domain
MSRAETDRRYRILWSERSLLMTQVIRRRQAAGWSREELAATAGLSIWTIRSVENAQNCVQRLTLEKLARAFGLTDPEELLQPYDVAAAGARGVPVRLDTGGDGRAEFYQALDALRIRTARAVRANPARAEELYARLMRQVAGMLPEREGRNG